MGFFEKRAEENLKSKRYKLMEEYKHLYVKCKTDKALAVLEELFELESYEGTAALLKTYKLGHLYANISTHEDIYKKMKYSFSYYREHNPVPASMDKVRFYLQKMLDRYGEKVKLPHNKLTVEENHMIGGLKVRMAYTYYHRPMHSKYVDGVRFQTFDESTRKEYAQYRKWIEDAVTLNQYHEASVLYALMFWQDYETFGLQKDLTRATILLVSALRNFNEIFRNRSGAEAFVHSILRFDICDLLRELAQENALADHYYGIVENAMNKALLQHRRDATALEYSTASIKEEILHVKWFDAATGERITNIQEVLHNMENYINHLDKLIEHS